MDSLSNRQTFAEFSLLICNIDSKEILKTSKVELCKENMRLSERATNKLNFTLYSLRDIQVNQ